MLAERRLTRGLFGLALVVASLVSAETAAPGIGPEVELDQLVHRSWNTEEGLPQSSVQSILQDRHGYLWLATQEGLARFDGVRFVLFDTRSSNPLPAANVLAILEVEDGLWIGTRGGGLSKLGWDGTIRTWGREAGLAGLQVQCLLADGDGLLVGTRGGGLQRFDPVTGRFSDPLGPIPSRMVVDLARDPDGSVWIGTEGDGVCRLREGTVECWGPDRGFPSTFVRAVAVDSRGRAWAGTHGGGLGYFEGGRWRFLTVADGLRSNRISALSVDATGTLWIGTGGRGCQRILAGRKPVLGEGHLLEEDWIEAFLTDREGNLWVGAETSGLHRFRASVFGMVRDRVGLPGQMARTVMEARDGSIWAGFSGKGLVRLQGRRVTRFGRSEGLPSEDVFSLYEDPRGRVWAGTYEGGLARIEGRRLRTWGPDEGLEYPTIWALAGDGADGVWAGTFGGGLYHIADRVREHLGRDDGLPSDLVRCLVRTADGALWIGTANGVARMADGHVEIPRGMEALSGITVFDVLEIPGGVLWLATNGDGLFRWDGRQLSHVGSQDGLDDGVVFRLLLDRTGAVWMTSNLGIRRVLLDVLESAATEKKLPLRVQWFGVPDGLATRECNGGSQPCGWAGSGDKLWFPTPEGLAVVSTRRAGLPNPTPVMVLETAEADGVPLARGRENDLPAGTDEIKVTYTALSFVAPEAMRFRYRLLGLDRRWTECGADRETSFSRLPPGRYRFQVQARNERSGWARPAAEVEFRIRPFLWQVPAFWAVMAAALVLLGFGLAQLSAARLRRRADELSQQVEDRTRDLLRMTLELEDANRRLETLSRHDPLTGLANRRHLDEEAARLLSEAAEAGEPVTLLMLDLDRFKAFNDRYGHQAGDRCLMTVAGVLGQMFRGRGRLASRWGGEEFVVLLEGVDEAEGQALAEAVRERVRAACLEHGTLPGGLGITVSIGVAFVVPWAGFELDSLLRVADAALYRAKENGRNRVETGKVETSPDHS